MGRHRGGTPTSVPDPRRLLSSRAPATTGAPDPGDRTPNRSARSTSFRCPAPARIYIPQLLDDVLAGTINPGRVFDYETDLDYVADAYTAMDQRRAIKSLIRVGSE